MSQIAVVILNWNGQKLLEQFLPSLLAHSPQAQIYLADNASTDTSVAFVKEAYPELKIIENSQNFGYAEGYNQALRGVDEPYFCLINSDVEVSQGWLDPILNCFELQPEVAIIQPKIRDFKEPSQFEYAGAAGGFIDRLGFPFCRGRVFDAVEADLGQYDSNTPIFWASGACFFIRKNCFEDLGGFDRDFFAHQEEIDLCWRAFNRGYQAVYCHQSTVYHVGGATLDYGNPQKTYLNFRNSLLMLLKNLPRKNLYLIVFLRLCLDGIAGIRLFVCGKPQHCFAIVRSHFAFYKRAKKFYAKRTENQKPNYFKINSIVYSFFIAGKKKYSDIF